MLSKKQIKNLLIPLTLAIFSISPALADTKDDMQIIENNMKKLGFESNGFERYELIDSDESKFYIMSTTPGLNYIVAGVCDVDCSDLDLSLRDMRTDTAVEIDYKTDDTPMVMFEATEDRYVVRVDMEECSTSSCFARVKGFSE